MVTTPPSAQDTSDDDDIVDLLEVVKPGKSTPAPPKEDFSADLDAVLQEFSESRDTESPPPFPDPSPVDHEVDPDEELPMPSMDDLNSLLASLGATPEPVASRPAPALVDDLDAAPVLAKSGVSKALEEALRAVPDDTAEAAAPPAPSPVEEPAAPAFPENPDELPVPLDDLPPEMQPLMEAPAPSLPEDIALQTTPAPELIIPEATSVAVTAAAPSEAVSKPAPALVVSVKVPPRPDPAREQQATAVAAVAPEAPLEQVDTPTVQTASSEETQRGNLDEVDLNELDALLDDMLASAPVSGPVPAAPVKTSTEAAGESALSPEESPVSDASASPAQASFPPGGGLPPAVRAECDALHVDVTTLRRDFDAMRDGTLLPLQESLRQAETDLNGLRTSLHENKEQFSSIRERLDRQEHMQTTAETAPGHAEPTSHPDGEALRQAQENAIRALERIDAVSADIARGQEELAALRASFGEMRETLTRMQDDQEKAAAKAAAKVIREELAAILQAEHMS